MIFFSDYSKKQENDNQEINTLFIVVMDQFSVLG